MPTATCSDFPWKSLQTKQKEGSFFSKPKISEDYHGGKSASASVPFAWESRPGTPKVRYLKNEEVTPTLPPLTPPPSYYSSSPATKRPSTGRNSRSSSTFCSAIFPKRNNASKPRLPSLSPASSSSSRSSSSFASSPISQSYSVPSSPVTTAASKPRQRNRMPNPRLSFDPTMDNEEQDQDELSAVSAFCSSLGVNDRSRGGCYASVFKVLLRDCK